jgi:hypothetical protein
VPIHVALELQPSRCVVAAVRRESDVPPEIVVAASLPHDQDLAKRLRALRRTWRLPPKLRLVLWPRSADPGVIAPAQEPDRNVELPPDAVVRRRAEAVIEAGFRIGSVVLPHRPTAALAGSLAPMDAMVLVLERRCGCLVLASGGAARAVTYLHWPAVPVDADEAQPALARYQFGAALAPHVRHLAAQSPSSGFLAFACGGMPNLRLQIVPLIEEIDHEIDALDGEFPGGVGVAGETSDAVSPSAFQVVVAATAK